MIGGFDDVRELGAMVDIVKAVRRVSAKVERL